MACARVLSDHFERVIVIDRDSIPSHPMIRDAIPQAHHQHHLLPGGLEILNRLFPNLNTDLDHLGGKTAGPSDWFAYTPNGKTYRVSRFQPEPIDGSAPLRMQSRALLEHVIRGYVEALPNVETRYNTHVQEIVCRSNRVVGVVSRSGDQVGGELIIDATGRVSRTIGWLNQLGFDSPPASKVECDFAYTSVLFKPIDPDAFEGAGFLISSARTGDYVKRGGSLVKIEDGKWLVTLAGRLGDYPPTKLKDMYRYMETLHTSRISDLLKNAQPISDPHQYLFPRSVNRHYEKLTAFPEGLLPIGDAICHINPGYAQGMSSVCRQVSVLEELIVRRRLDGCSLDGLWRDFFPGVFEQTRAPWLFAALMDFSKKGTRGDFPEYEEETVVRLKELSALADAGDKSAARLIDQVFDMQLPLSALSPKQERHQPPTT